MSVIPATAASQRSPWPAALATLAGLLGLILIVYRQTAAGMVTIWSTSDTFAHGFLVVPLTLWMVWRDRERLGQLTPQPQFWALLVMVPVAAVWLLADLVAVNAAAQFALVALLALAVPAVLGLQVAKAILFPLLFLFFAVPFGEFMLQPMMTWTADFVVFALRLTGIPVYREGLQFVIPTGNWSVIDECSGVRYLIASFMVGSLFAYLNYRSHLRRAVFMVVSLLVPIIANWLRAYIIVMMGHLSGNKLAVGVDHLLYGWVFFGVVIFIMFTIGMRWAQPEEVRNGATNSAAVAIDGAESPVGSRFGALLVAAGALVLLPHMIVWHLRSADLDAEQPRLSLPDNLSSGWSRNGDPLVDDWKPQFHGANVEGRGVYAGPAGRVGAYIAYYRAQTASGKLVSSVNDVVGINDRTWNRVATANRQIEADGITVRMRMSEILGPQRGAASNRPHLVTWQAYWIDGRWLAGDAEAKLFGALTRLRGRGDDGAVLVMYAEHGSVDASEAALRAFAQANLATFSQALARTRDAK